MNGPTWGEIGIECRRYPDAQGRYPGEPGYGQGREPTAPVRVDMGCVDCEPGIGNMCDSCTRALVVEYERCAKCGGPLLTVRGVVVCGGCGWGHEELERRYTLDEILHRVECHTSTPLDVAVLRAALDGAVLPRVVFPTMEV